jgi:type II secretory pathway pseudopilin PulG
MNILTVKKRYRGASAIEIAISVLVIVFIVGGILALFNPNKKIAQKRNETRIENVNTISNAISLYLADNGSYSLTTMPIGDNCVDNGNQICKTSSASCEGLIDLNLLTRTNKYLSSIPVDPASKSQLGTGYNVVKSESGVITVCAPLAEQKVDISLSK